MYTRIELPRAPLEPGQAWHTFTASPLKRPYCSQVSLWPAPLPPFQLRQAEPANLANVPVVKPKTSLTHGTSHLDLSEWKPPVVRDDMGRRLDHGYPGGWWGKGSMLCIRRRQRQRNTLSQRQDSELKSGYSRLLDLPEPEPHREKVMKQIYTYNWFTKRSIHFLSVSLLMHHAVSTNIDMLKLYTNH